MKKILVVTTKFPFPLLSGDKLRIYNIFKYLSKKAYQILKEVKADSGLVVFHPFRVDKYTREWIYSPHFHVLGFGEWC